MKIKANLLLLSCVFLTTGCVRNSSLRDQVLSYYHNGNGIEAEKQLTTVIEKSLPNHDYTQSDDAVWLLLDRATIRFANGNLDEAILDYDKAIAAIDYYNQNSTKDDVCELILSDQASAYSAEDYEQLLAPTYSACALLQKGDESNASALLRFALNLETLKNELNYNDQFKKKFPPINNIAGKYLLATLLERSKDYSNAAILYKQCGVSQILSKDPRKSTLLIILHNGNIPYKRSVRVSADIASMALLECLLSGVTNKPPALSSFTGVSVPQLIDWPCSSPLEFSLNLNNQIIYPTLSYDLRCEALTQLEQNLPYIAAKNLARFIIRRSTVAIAEQQNPTLGALADFGMTIANFATLADTRSWSTLPAKFDIFRLDLEAGYHTLSASWADFPTLKLSENSLCVINIFYVHPGHLVVQIPERFINS